MTCSFKYTCFDPDFPGKPNKTPTPFRDPPPSLPPSPRGAAQESPSTRLEELTGETPDSSKTQVALAQTIPDSLGVLKRGLTVGP